MKIGIYPGSFDPVTFGHIDIINRSLKIVDKLIVAILMNSNKQNLFTFEEREKLLKECFTNIDKVEIKCFTGLLVDFAKENDACCIVRGLRAFTDYDYELMLAQTNKVLYDNIDTIFLTTSLKYSYLSSTIVKDVASHDGDISKFVPENVAIALKDKYNKIKRLKTI